MVNIFCIFYLNIVFVSLISYVMELVLKGFFFDYEVKLDIFIKFVYWINELYFYRKEIVVLLIGVI